MKGSHQ